MADGNVNQLTDENDWAHHHVILALAEMLECDPNSISPSDRLADLFVDSLGLVEGILYFEEKFQRPEATGPLDTVEDLIVLVRKRT